jgi:hypothetical protein
VPLITLTAGAKMLVDELRDGGSHVELVLGGEPRMGPLAAEQARPAVRLSVRPSKDSHPYLKDHTIAGTPVVPVVMAVEWFARAAGAMRPDLVLGSINDVKVLRGIKLADFSAGVWLDVHAKELSNGTGSILALELRGTNDALHYTATAQMNDDRSVASEQPATVEMEPFKGKVYDGKVLFHGADFQVITKMQGIGDNGIAATLNGTIDAGWTKENWQTDPAALDGGLQLALLWSQRALGGPSLPMAVGAMHAYTDAPAPGPLNATLKGAVKGRDRAISDIVFTDTEGAVVAELRGVETILLPS